MCPGCLNSTATSWSAQCGWLTVGWYGAVVIEAGIHLLLVFVRNHRIELTTTEEHDKAWKKLGCIDSFDLFHTCQEEKIINVLEWRTNLSATSLPVIISASSSSAKGFESRVTLAFSVEVLIIDSRGE